VSLVNKQCPTCGAYLAVWSWTLLRCPWATPGARSMMWIDGIAAEICTRPYKDRRTDIEAPITGGKR